MKIGTTLFLALGVTTALAASGLAAYGVDEDSRVFVDNTDVFRATMNAFGIALD